MGYYYGVDLGRLSIAAFIILGVSAIFLIPLISNIISGSSQYVKPGIKEVEKSITPKNEYWRSVEGLVKWFRDWGTGILSNRDAVGVLVSIDLLLLAFIMYTKFRRG